MKRLIITALLSSSLASQALAARLVPASAAPEAAASAVAPATPARTVIAAAPAAPAATPQAPAPATPARTAASHSAFYIGAQVGDSTIGALLGYQISRMYAMEISYDYVDPIYTATTSLKTSRASASGLALFPIKFSEMGPMAIFIKVGYTRTTDKYTVNDPGLGIPAFPATSTVTTTLKTGVSGGAGVQVDLSNNTTARLGGNYVGGDRSVYLAAIYKF